MAQAVAMNTPTLQGNAEQKRPIPYRKLAVGALMNISQVTSLRQPLEVIKTHLAANRQDTLRDAFQKTWSRGRFLAFYQGLIPWAWLEASTKGAILIVTSSEIEYHARSKFNASPTVCGALGGIGGGTTCMKTVEVTRSKMSVGGARVPGALEMFFQIIREKGTRGVNKGVNAVALRQVTGWSSRVGITHFAEESIRKVNGKPKDEKLEFGEKILASTIGGALSCWNQPFEVGVAEMCVARGNAFMKNDPARPASPAIVSTFKYIFSTTGVKGLFRSVVPRIGVAAWATICMVGFGDTVKEIVNRK
ncbi:mitochondrial DNA replication protein [Aspergillus eucalypticola CBS 122712]|uniref:Mitochondrial DNA replication protein n=1 Tax=Aspergillus eucalypticola (strain CBS 122712 / IBT 29274) TaxID=1448314 RepID=A0A317V8G2_ASPEC|nr:mitochondrial DNA replication protein [Aspergillus eucalypticola CBS 122712]PWY68360.1 mitochondrial DNA replication protein [Aspergillus eucalypticola CBS 122712]